MDWKKKDHTYYSLYTFIGTYIRYIFLKITMLNLRNKDNKIFINLLISQKSIPKVHTLTQTDPNNNGWTPIHFAVCKVPVYMNIFWLMYKYKKCDNQGGRNWGYRGYLGTPIFWGFYRVKNGKWRYFCKN